MSDPVLLTLALLASIAGSACLSLAIDANWQRVHGFLPSRRSVVRLRLLGTAAWSASLLLCLQTDHVSIATLVWFMSLAAGSLAVALMLAWRPQWLAVFR